MITNNNGVKVFGFSLISIAIIIFYVLFFKLAPYVASVIPAGEWHQLGAILVYIVIGYCGGLVLPLCIFVYGVFMLIVSFTN